MKLLWGTANLFSHKRYMNGASTNPDFSVVAHGGFQVKNAIDAMKGRGKLKIMIEKEGQNIKINVTPDLIGAAVSIVSMSGQSLKSDVLTDVNNTISFDGISTGIYQVVVSTSTEKTTERVYIK